MCNSTLSLTLTLDWVAGQHHSPVAIIPEKRPDTYCTGGLVGPKNGLDENKKSVPARYSIPDPTSPQQFAIPTMSNSAFVSVEIFPTTISYQSCGNI